MGPSSSGLDGRSLRSMESMVGGETVPQVRHKSLSKSQVARMGPFTSVRYQRMGPFTVGWVVRGRGDSCGLSTASECSKRSELWTINDFSSNVDQALMETSAGRSFPPNQVWFQKIWNFKNVFLKFLLENVLGIWYLRSGEWSESTFFEKIRPPSPRWEKLCLKSVVRSSQRVKNVVECLESCCRSFQRK